MEEQGKLSNDENQGDLRMTRVLLVLIAIPSDLSRIQRLLHGDWDMSRRMKELEEEIINARQRTRIDDGFFSRPPHSTATEVSVPKPILADCSAAFWPIAAHVLYDGTVTIAAPVLVVGHSPNRSQSPLSIVNNQESVEGHGPPFP